MEQFPQTSTPPAAEKEDAEETPSAAHQQEPVKVEPVQKGKSLSKKKKTRRGRKKSSNLASVENAFIELPFANVDIGALFEISRTFKKKEKRKRKLLENDDGGTTKKQQRANYFISLPIENPKILGDIQSFQDSVLEKDERLSRAMIPKGSFHLTLFVMHLATEEEIGLATTALLESKEPVEEILQGKTLVLSFNGVSEFKNEVVFGKVIEDDSFATLKEIIDTIEQIFKEKGIFPVGYKSVVPHLTLMKLSRAPNLRKQGVKKIDPGLYQHFQGNFFGEELLHRFDLCSMVKKRQLNGYYHTEASIYFANTSVFIGREPSITPEERRHTEDTVYIENNDEIKESQQKGGHIQTPVLLKKWEKQESSDLQGKEQTQKEDLKYATSKHNAALGGLPSDAVLQTTRVHQRKSSDIKVELLKKRHELSLSDASQAQKARVRTLPFSKGQRKLKCSSKLSIGTKETSQQNLPKADSQSQDKFSSQALTDMVSLQKRRMEAERQQWENNEQNMCLLFESLAAIQEQQRSTNKYLKDIHNELSLIGKQLGHIAQLFQPAVGTSTACKSNQTDPAPPSSLKEGFPQEEGIMETPIEEDTK